jgi:hypothetical protein
VKFLNNTTVIGLSLILAACGGGGDGQSVTVLPVTPAVQTITVAPSLPIPGTTTDIPDVQKNAAVEESPVFLVPFWSSDTPQEIRGAIAAVNTPPKVLQGFKLVNQFEGGLPGSQLAVNEEALITTTPQIMALAPDKMKAVEPKHG